MRGVEIIHRASNKVVIHLLHAESVGRKEGVLCKLFYTECRRKTGDPTNDRPLNTTRPIRASRLVHKLVLNTALGSG